MGKKEVSRITTIGNTTYYQQIYNPMNICELMSRREAS